MPAEDRDRFVLDWRLGVLAAGAGLLGGVVAGSFSLVGIFIQGDQVEDSDLRQATAALKQADRQADQDRAQLQAQFTYEQRNRAYFGFQEATSGFTSSLILCVRELIGQRTSRSDEPGSPTYARLSEVRLGELSDDLYSAYLNIGKARARLSFVGRDGTVAAADAVSDWAFRVVQRLSLVEDAGNAPDVLYQLYLTRFLDYVQAEDESVRSASDRFTGIAKEDLTAVTDTPAIP